MSEGEDGLQHPGKSQHEGRNLEVCAGVFRQTRGVVFVEGQCRREEQRRELKRREKGRGGGGTGREIKGFPTVEGAARDT